MRIWITGTAKKRARLPRWIIWWSSMTGSYRWRTNPVRRGRCDHCIISWMKADVILPSGYIPEIWEPNKLQISIKRSSRFFPYLSICCSEFMSFCNRFHSHIHGSHPPDRGIDRSYLASVQINPTNSHARRGHNEAWKLIIPYKMTGGISSAPGSTWKTGKLLYCWHPVA